MQQLKSEQFLPISIDYAWDFFSSPENLKHITPPHMGFDIIPGYGGKKMYPGQIIRYIVRPIFGLSMQWTTEITQVRAPYFFIDEQRFGPYAFWHHQHIFEEVEGGIKMTDWVHYKVPLGKLGQALAGWYVRAELAKIFTYRTEVLNKMFNTPKN